MKINLNELIKKIQNKELNNSQIHYIRIKEKDIFAPSGAEAEKYTNQIYFELCWELDDIVTDEEQVKLINKQLDQVIYFIFLIFECIGSIERQSNLNNDRLELASIFTVKNLRLNKEYIENLTKILTANNILTEVIKKSEKMGNQLHFVQKYANKYAKYLQKMINFIGIKFYLSSTYKEDISDYHLLKLYQEVRGTYFFKTNLAKIACKFQNITIAPKKGKELYNIYLTDPQLIKSLHKVESCIKDIYFKFKLICKEFNPESPFSWLPKEVIHHVVSFLGNYSLYDQSHDEPNIMGDL